MFKLDLEKAEEPEIKLSPSGRRRAERSFSMFKVRRDGCEEMPGTCETSETSERSKVAGTHRVILRKTCPPGLP